jgi:hypothetical protein
MKTYKLNRKIKKNLESSSVWGPLILQRRPRGQPHSQKTSTTTTALSQLPAAIATVACQNTRLAFRHYKLSRLNAR